MYKLLIVFFLKGLKLSSISHFLNDTWKKFFNIEQGYLVSVESCPVVRIKVKKCTNLHYVEALAMREDVSRQARNLVKSEGRSCKS